MTSRKSFVRFAKPLLLVCTAVVSMATSAPEPVERVLTEISDVLGIDSGSVNHRLLVAGDSGTERLISVHSTVSYSAPEGTSATLRVILVGGNGDESLVEQDTLELSAGESKELRLDVPVALQCDDSPCEQELWLKLERIDGALDGTFAVDSSIESTPLLGDLLSDRESVVLSID